MTHTDHGVLDYLVAVNANWWQGLPEDQREQLATIMEEVTAERNAEVIKIEEASRQRLLDTGAEIREFTDEQRQVWVDAMKPVWEKFSDDGLGRADIPFISTWLPIVLMGPELVVR